jgi:NAD(P)-dependent dehydrogenase (short-subunit alcohol dehydrogenase family)
MAKRLKDMRCLIVGGTGGIGLAAARRFLEEAAAVVIAGLDSDEGQAAIAKLAGLGPVKFSRCDATDPEQIEQLHRDSLAFLGGLDVLYHVAGASGRRFGDGPLHECSVEGWQATLDANLKSVFLSNRMAVRHFLREKQGGTILNLSSALALAPAPKHFDTCAYTAAKAGIIGLSRLAAASYAANAIRVNVLALGLLDTPMSQRAVNDPEVRRFLLGKQPLSLGPGAPEDCSEASVFLCSAEARFITGVVLPVDGGWCVGNG